MKMTIFDARSPGIPTEKPKGNIELTAIGDQFSTARIIKTDNPIDPIRVGDIVYSAAWSPNQPMRFALVGKIDVNRDGKDDREELKRMIQEAGGVVDFDLPPPGRRQGDGHAVAADRLVRHRRSAAAPRDVTSRQTEQRRCRGKSKLEKRMGEVIKEARLNGIRPMPIERLLAFLGYDMNAPVVGRAEAVDTNAMRRITCSSPHLSNSLPPSAAGGADKADTKARRAQGRARCKTTTPRTSRSRKTGTAKKKPAAEEERRRRRPAVIGPVAHRSAERLDLAVRWADVARPGRINRLWSSCSITCAAQPATRAIAKIGV